MDNSNKRIAFYIAHYLRSFAAEHPGVLSPEQIESLDIASQCVSDVFAVDPDLDEHKCLFMSSTPAGATSLHAVFAAYDSNSKSSSSAQAAAAPTKKRSGSPPGAAANKASSSSPSSTAATWQVSAEDKAKAEQFKREGNDLMAAADYEAAVDKYTEAHSYDPSSPVYMSNRAAAHSSLGNHGEAIEDARRAIDIDPCFAKAYSRLGHAYFATNKFEDAASAYQRGLNIEPTNVSMKNALAQATLKLNSSAPGGGMSSGRQSAKSGNNKNRAVARDGASSSGSSSPLEEPAEDISMPAGMDMPGGLQSLLGNPQLMRMAQDMMSKNPNLAQMAQQFMRNNPNMDMESMMNNPELMQAAQQAASSGQFGNNLGGGGGAGGSGSGSGGNSSSRRK